MWMQTLKDSLIQNQKARMGKERHRHHKVSVSNPSHTASPPEQTKPHKDKGFKTKVFRTENTGFKTRHNEGRTRTLGRVRVQGWSRNLEVLEADSGSGTGTGAED